MWDLCLCKHSMLAILASLTGGEMGRNRDKDRWGKRERKNERQKQENKGEQRKEEEIKR